MAVAHLAAPLNTRPPRFAADASKLSLGGVGAGLPVDIARPRIPCGVKRCQEPFSIAPETTEKGS
jgi:hypothetical protein